MQALNRLQPGPFDADDIERMRAFAAQAAVALDNASLFREVVGRRNYNESILRSMSSGVISLDIDGRLVKRNPTATTILGLAQTEEDHSVAQAFVDGLNPWLAGEMAAVRESGEAKMLLDTDIATNLGTKSANVSIVPLVDGET